MPKRQVPVPRLSEQDGKWLCMVEGRNQRLYPEVGNRYRCRLVAINGDAGSCHARHRETCALLTLFSSGSCYLLAGLSRGPCSVNNSRLVLPLVATREGALCCWQGATLHPKHASVLLLMFQLSFSKSNSLQARVVGSATFPSSAVPAWFQSLER